MASQRDVIFIAFPAEQVLSAAITALQTIGVDVQEVDTDARLVIATRGLSSLSWGERITVRVEQVTNTQSAVRIESRERFPLQVIDWGQNSRNIDRFEAELWAALEQQDTTAAE